MSMLGSWVKHFALQLGYEIRSLTKSPHPYGYELWQDVARLSRRLSWPIEVVFDVGANNGATTLRILETFPTARVFAFEPNPPTFEHLDKAVQSERATKLPIALSDLIGTLPFYDYAESDLIGSLARNAGFAKEHDLEPTTTMVECSTVDQVCRDHAVDRISVLKIDAEGADFSVLQGAERMLRNAAVDFVYFEFNDYVTPPDVDGGGLREVCDWLHSFGFVFIATYTDRIEVLNGDVFVVSNALMMRKVSMSPS